jgi:hypothetical protein
MKLLKYFSFAALSLFMVACSDDDVVLNTATGVTVNVSKVALSANEDNAGNEVAVKVPIAITGDANGPVRVTVEFAPVGADGAVEDVDYIATSKVINISEEDKEANVEIYTVPNTVENDTKSFTVTITNVDGAALGESYVTTVTLVDNDVVIPAEWEDLGMCTFTDPFYSYGYFDEAISYKVKLERNAEDPSEYRLVNPYGEEFANALAKSQAPGEEETFIAEMEEDCPVFYVKDTEENPHYLYFYLYDKSEDEAVQDLDTDGVYIPLQKLPLDFGQGEMYVMSYGYYLLAYGDYSYDSVKNAGYMGTYRKGVVKFPSQTLLLSFDLSTLYWANSGLDVNLVVEAGVSLGDYSASIDYLGLYSATTGDHKAVVSVTTGKDVKSAKVACATGSADALVTAIKNGSAETVTVGGNTTETVTLDIASEGTYTFAVVTYDGSSEQETATTTARISFGGSGSSDDSADWKSLGYADFTDGWILPAFFGGDNVADLDDYTYTIEVKESKTTAGVYKLVAPYGDSFFLYNYFSDITREDPNNTDIIINASDPNCVIVEPQYSGFTFNPYAAGSGYEAYNWGEHYVHNVEGYIYYALGYDNADDIHETMQSRLGMGEEYNSFMEDGMIVIPLPMFANALGDYELGYNWTYVYPTIVSVPTDASRASVKSFAKAKSAQKAKAKAIRAKAVRSISATAKKVSPTKKATKLQNTQRVAPGKRL